MKVFEERKCPSCPWTTDDFKAQPPPRRHKSEKRLFLKSKDKGQTREKDICNSCRSSVAHSHEMESCPRKVGGGASTDHSQKEKVQPPLNPCEHTQPHP